MVEGGERHARRVPLGGDEVCWALLGAQRLAALPCRGCGKGELLGTITVYLWFFFLDIYVFFFFDLVFIHVAYIYYMAVITP